MGILTVQLVLSIRRRIKRGKDLIKFFNSVYFMLMNSENF